jgi:ABC-type multidrug transport system fused ATPase/permease subunit
MNRIFLVLPQHAFADGLIVICKNYIQVGCCYHQILSFFQIIFFQSEVFKRYYINPYVSPISGDLLTWNYTSLVICGIVFMILNYLIESGYLRRLLDCVRQGNMSNYEMKLTSQSSVLKRGEKVDFYPLAYALKVDSLSKTYDGNEYAVSDVTFGVQKGECFGLLGANGAGKSTIFAILSGQIVPTTGDVEYFDNVSWIVWLILTNL